MSEATVKEITRVKSIKKLPDGEYKGLWGGNIVNAFIGKHFYQLKVSVGIRTFAAPCVVTVKDGKATVRTK
jgi:hypothetical protein